MAAAAGERLADDLILEILAHAYTDAVTLFRCAVTCKRWCALVANLSFLRRRWPEREHHPSSLIGFFVQQQRCDENNGLLQPVFLPPLSGSVLGSHRRSLTSFTSGLPLDELDGVVPLAARHGLLLVRLARQAIDDPARLAVCNLLAGTWDVLPSLKRGVFSVNCTIVTGADCCSSNRHHQQAPLSPSYHSNFFKVLAIVADDSRNDHQECNNLYTLLSIAPGWSEPKNCLEAVKQSGEHDLPVLQWRNKVVVCGDVAHWLMSSMSKHYILFISIETDAISLNELSIPKELHATRRYIGGPTLCVTAAGLPSLFWLQEEGLDMWMPAGDGACPYARTVELKPPKMWNPSLVHVWSGEKSGALLIIDTFRCVHMVDLESGVMEDMSEQFRSSRGMMAIPMEIDWPALFLSPLGGG